MLMPSIFGENLFDDFFNFPFGYYTTSTSDLMKTDIKDADDHYEITMNLPGIKKENVKAELKDGYMTIHVSSNTNNDEKDENGKYIRRERFSGNCSRSFYVGDQITEEDIKAKFENGTLTMIVPKKKLSRRWKTKNTLPLKANLTLLSYTPMGRMMRSIFLYEFLLQYRRHQIFKLFFHRICYPLHFPVIKRLI